MRLSRSVDHRSGSSAEPAAAGAGRRHRRATLAPTSGCRPSCRGYAGDTGRLRGCSARHPVLRRRGARCASLPRHPGGDPRRRARWSGAAIPDPGVTLLRGRPPNTQADKRASVDRRRRLATAFTFACPRPRRRPLLDEALTGARHRSTEPTLFLADGSLRYPSEVTVHELFPVTVPGSAPGRRSAPHVPRRELRHGGEPGDAPRGVAEPGSTSHPLCRRRRPPPTGHHRRLGAGVTADVPD